MESRQEHRYTASPETVLVSILNSRQERRFAARLLDISKSGCSMASPQALAPSRNILVVMDRLAIFGTVRRCQRADGGRFRVGVEITRLELAGEAAA